MYTLYPCFLMNNICAGSCINHPHHFSFSGIWATTSELKYHSTPIPRWNAVVRRDPLSQLNNSAVESGNHNLLKCLKNQYSARIIKKYEAQRTQDCCEKKRAIAHELRRAKGGFVACFLGSDTLCRSVHAVEGVKLSQIGWFKLWRGVCVPWSFVNGFPRMPFTSSFETEPLISLARCHVVHTWPASLQRPPFRGLPSGHCCKHVSWNPAFHLAPEDWTQVLPFSRQVHRWLSLASSSSSEATPGPFGRQVLFKPMLMVSLWTWSFVFWKKLCHF